MTLAMALSLCIPILLETVHTTGVTLDIDFLVLVIEDVSYQEHGVEHSLHVFVSITGIPKKTQYTIII